MRADLLGAVIEHQLIVAGTLIFLALDPGQHLVRGQIADAGKKWFPVRAVRHDADTNHGVDITM